MRSDTTSSDRPSRAVLSLKLVAWLQILGASWATLIVAQIILRGGRDANAGLAVLAVILISLVGFAGVQTIRGHWIGPALSLAVQVLQLFQITVGSLVFRFIAGPQLTIYYLGQGEFSGFVGITATLALWRHIGDPPFAFGVNVLALAAILVLLRAPGTPRQVDRSAGSR